MEVASLGYRTSLFFAAFDGQIIDRGNYQIIRTPTNPSFFWGNYLLFDRPPADGDYKRWCKLFADEIGSPPQVKHQTFGWDSSRDELGVIEPFLQNGFHREFGDVLAARQLHSPPRPASGLTVRPLCSDEEWDQSVENLVITREPEHSETGYRIFARGQMIRYRSMTDAGLGAWYGAFIGDRLVADLGIFGSVLERKSARSETSSIAMTAIGWRAAPPWLKTTPESCKL
jgi:hypothetical protein